MSDTELRRWKVSLPVITDEEMNKELKDFFDQRPEIKKQWWYRAAILEKLEKERRLQNV